ncbi:LOW QUALITY PROTEIN: BTB/POZ domain-containing protein KCTD9-like [Haliotis rubra]|uniref:LOW QUALITY PROTEIN: BTB/POZ domain-containing protein KCTD9-like n=1 Tax=Haliotis rubra TaxID=36100 RepID=UPI001EE4F65F|nr:LOW QUALITY PROTEIN: BTB/POZ domain-containing protein KCTD9-like [Haliotis rubra]
MKRIVVYNNGSTVGGKVVAVSESLDETLAEIGQKLGIQAKCLYTGQGGLIDDVPLLRDDEKIYVSEGDPFIALSHSTPRVVSPLRPKSDPPGPHKKCTKSEWVTLNVGGTMFTTTRGTLTRTDPDSMLARMFNSENDVSWSSSCDVTGAYLIDRSARYFQPILNYLRHGQLILDKQVNPEGVLEEAKFFGIGSLIEELEELIERDQPADDTTPITRRDLVLRLLATPTTFELRCQGMNFSGANLSKLDLRLINFKYAVFKNADLSGANLTNCNFERADLTRAKFDSANLLGVKMLCANLEGASLKGCNFEDPAGSRANMEGALMKNVNLEGSHMAGVNLRVATLKNANLQNCALRGADLAGADLENCDLSGCDLQEANLRGANLKGAAFELMVNPLHMAQAVR